MKLAKSSKRKARKPKPNTRTKALLKLAKDFIKNPSSHGPMTLVDPRGRLNDIQATLDWVDWNESDE